MEIILMIILWVLFIYTCGSVIRSIYELFKTLQSVKKIKQVEYKLRALLDTEGLEPEEFSHQLDKLLEELNQID